MTQPLNKAFFPNTNLFGGTGLPVLCWGTGYLDDDDETIISGDPEEGGGVFMPFPDKLQILDQLLNKADEVLLADGSLQSPKRLGIRYIRSFYWYASKPTQEWIDLRRVLNKHLQSSMKLTLYPSGHHEFGFECFISKITSSALNDSQLAESINIELTAKEVTSKINDLVINPQEKIITVVYPNGGENFSYYELIHIQWTYSGEITNVLIEIGINRGLFVEYITIDTVAANLLSYDWNASEYGNQCYIRITESGGTVSDISDASFRIAPPS